MSNEEIIFQDEISAVLEAVKSISNLRLISVHIFCDIQRVLHALESHGGSLDILFEIRNSLEIIGFHRVHFHWIYSHTVWDFLLMSWLTIWLRMEHEEMS